MDIKPPQKRPTKPVPKPLPAIEPSKPVKSLPERSLKIKRPKQWWKWVLLGIAGLAVVVIMAAISWYTWALRPLDSTSTEQIRVTVETGDTPGIIANTLQKSGIVRSATAVRVYSQLTGTKNKLQAGSYTLSPSQSVPDIIDHLVKGSTDELTLTISPGVTLRQLRVELKKHGYSDAEITEAYNASYSDLPLFADKPAGTSLEGYIFPETFNVDPNSDLQDLFRRSFEELYKNLQQENLIEKFKSRGLTVYQALTLASIIQKEESDPADQKQVAQVFYLRLDQEMALESDPTFIYAANQLGVEPSITIDSPYNTRKYPGLPPGPIANMNLTALQAVADPAPGNYLYFVAGDDGITYFSHTLDQHLENVRKHCHDLCN